jgi:hypothetical protein
MGKRTITTTVPAPRVIYYQDPATELAPRTARQVAARQRDYQITYQRWATRQVALIEHDRKVRHALLGFGAVVGTATVAGIGALIWLVWHALTAASPGLLAVPVGLIVLGLLGAVGHRCITIVQHWH